MSISQWEEETLNDIHNIGLAKELSWDLLNRELRDFKVAELLRLDKNLITLRAMIKDQIKRSQR